MKNKRNPQIRKDRLLRRNKLRAIEEAVQLFRSGALYDF